MAPVAAAYLLPSIKEQIKGKKSLTPYALALEPDFDKFTPILTESYSTIAAKEVDTSSYSTVQKGAEPYVEYRIVMSKLSATTIICISASKLIFI